MPKTCMTLTVGVIRKAYLCLTILGAILSCLTTRALAADELVTFESARSLSGGLQQRRAQESGEDLKVAPEIINGYLSKPEGHGSFPAVVYLHSCSGLSKSSRDRISELFSSWGYVTLAVDSFGTRGIKETCNGPTPNRQGDAWGALLYLSKLSFVDMQRVAIVGSSQGGIVSLELASARSFKLFDIPENLNFKAAVAFYPLCSEASERLAIPTIILIGELDDWTPARNCERWMERRSETGASAKLVVYPGAYHSFDIPTLGDGKRLFGHWLTYNSEAAQRSQIEMHEFLETQFSK